MLIEWLVLLLAKTAIIAALPYFALAWVIKNVEVESAKTILEYIKVLIWPLVVLSSAVMFRGDISDLIRRIVKGSIFGNEINLLPPAQNDSSEVNLASVPAEEKTALVGFINTQQQELENSRTTVEQLKNQLAERELFLDFERIYQLIFASQIRLLDDLSHSEFFALARVALHFQVTKNTFPAVFSNWDTNQYVSFLIRSELMAWRDTHCLEITPKGRAFLEYLRIMNYRKQGI
ncbi:MAG: hypothetical protein UX60_C0001G0004 [Berkelbacteria bacterium GW2011_GWA2_46_7]|nr:MAG: hypothetical protein UX60_C0001G0004 [Berkelbacteria bacterium GW2011_GWA2_46_7]